MPRRLSPSLARGRIAFGEEAGSGPMETADTFGLLLGTWRVSRAIEDRRARSLGSFVGTATLTEATSRPAAPGATARYEESGEVRFGAHAGTAGRRLDYLRTEGPVVMVRFLDGRPFVDLDLRTGVWRCDHLCGADRYEIATFVRSPDQLEEHWRVTGPAKDYVAVTTLIRVTDGGTD